MYAVDYIIQAQKLHQMFQIKLKTGLHYSMVYIQQDTQSSFQSTRKEFDCSLFSDFMYIVLTSVKYRPVCSFKASLCATPSDCIQGIRGSARLDQASAHGRAAYKR